MRAESPVLDAIGSSRRALVAVTLAAVLLGAAATGWTGDPRPDAASPAAAAEGAGWRVQVDPATGIYTNPAPAAPTAPKADQGRAADLVVTPGTSPAGGYKIRLDDSAAAHQEAH
jgi:hypothetical protein